jgi:hypothetical protein
LARASIVSWAGMTVLMVARLVLDMRRLALEEVDAAVR